MSAHAARSSRPHSASIRIVPTIAAPDQSLPPGQFTQDRLLAALIDLVGPFAFVPVLHQLVEHCQRGEMRLASRLAGKIARREEGARIGSETLHAGIVAWVREVNRIVARQEGRKA